MLKEAWRTAASIPAQKLPWIYKDFSGVHALNDVGIGDGEYVKLGAKELGSATEVWDNAI